MSRARGQGGKPLPSNVKELKGTDRPCRMNTAEPEFNIDDIRPLRPLSDDAQEVWDQYLPMLIEAGVATNPDVEAFASLCDAVALYRQCTAEIDANGFTKIGANGSVRRSPYLIMRNDALRQMRDLLTEFGMTPSSRSRVVSTKGKQKGNRFTGFKKTG